MKVTPTKQTGVVTFKTKPQLDEKKSWKWWQAGNDQQLTNQILSTVAYMKDNQNFRNRQASIYARLYGNQSLYNVLGNNTNAMDGQRGLPTDRPTFNLVQATVDTLISRISQSRPAPVFLTDAGDYKERNLAKRLNNFIQGEFYQTKAYDKTAIALKDALVEGTGVIKVYERDNKIALDRVLFTELFVDLNESRDGDPRQLHQIKLMDRDMLIEMAPKYKSLINKAETAYPDTSSDSSRSVADLIMVIESWHLKSGKDAKDGRHVITCSSGILFDEEWDKDKFPFVFMHYSPRMVGFWAQGLAEQLMGTQLEINALLFQISKSIKLFGVPRIFVETGSKVTKAAHNNEIGTIIEYRGVKPSYEVAQCVPQELYAQLQRLIEYGFQQSGVSALQATSQKPAGLNSGEAIRSYDDISTDRFASLARKYDNLFVDLAYIIIDMAKDICEREGTYQTVYPNKDGTKEIDLPEASLLKDPFVIQAFNQSSLPRDPAGRFQKITEMVQAGMITIKEGRRLLDYPDLDQVEKLANASEERIYKYLDEIIEDGKYTPPDPFMDLALASELVTQYYNLYVAANLEEDKAQMLRDFKTQTEAIKQMAAAQQPGAPGGPTPQAQAAPLPISPLVPNAQGM